MKTLKIWILNFINGFCMSLADSVPGVSGGTVAFLLGFYDNFIGSLDKLFRGNFEEKKDAIKFLIKIGIGWVVGFVIAALVLENIFEQKIYFISSLFIGFIVFAIPVVIYEERKTLKGKYLNFVFTIIGIAIVAIITYFSSMNGNVSLNIENLNIGLTIYIFISAAIAISAMVLPGISGSTLLLIFGLYAPIVTTAIPGFLHMNFSYVPVLIVFGLGIITGMVLFVGLIRKAIENYRSQTVYTIIGMMIGSLYSIVQGPTTLKVPQDAMSFNTFNIIAFIIGGIIICGLQAFKLYTEKTTEKNLK